MKNIFRIILICISFLLLACRKDTPQPQPDPQPQSETRTLTFNLPSYTDADASQAFKSVWVPGDCIVVHGEYAKDQVKVTLEAGDISADGKSAVKKVEGLYPYTHKECSSVLYASYPAAASDNLNHCFFYSKFSTTNEKLMAAYNDGDVFNFDNVCGALTFSADPSFEGFTINGLRKEPLGYEFLQVKFTNTEANFKQYLGAPVISIDGQLVDGKATINIPDGLMMSGCIIKFKKNGQYVAIYKGNDPICINRGSVKDLGDISAEINPYDDPFSSDILDLDAQGNANCYVVTAPGKYKFKAVKGNNSTAFLSDVADASLLWESWNNDQEVTVNSVIASVTFAEDYMIIHTPDILKSGNAVVAALDADGTVLWSWHIWVPVNEIQTSTFGGLYGDSPIMDRNLGALVAAKTGEQVTVESYGLTYQWGRKDPFPGPAAVTSGDGDPATVAGLESEVAPALISLEESIAHPNLMGHQNSGDWLDIFDNGLWRDDEKTIYDPCPAGYRVPAYNSSMPMFSSSLTSVTGWSVDMDKGYITMGSPAMVIPIGGYRDDYGVGSFAKIGKRVAIWAARNNTDIAGYHMNLRPDGGTFAIGGTGKSRGCYVRCVKED